MRLSHLIYALSLTSLLALGACGRDTGYLYEEKPVTHQEPLGETKLRDPYRQFIWQFNCPTSASPLPTPHAGPGELVLGGTGPHEIDRYRLQNTAMKVQGQICPPLDSQRDVVMVFDVSGSSSRSDPTNGHTCGRLDAFEAVLATVNWKSTRVGAITFDNEIQATSGSLFDSRDALVAELEKNTGSKLYDIICMDNSLTEYTSPLKEAGYMLGRGRELSSKELFFVSDGQPIDEKKAEAVADELRKRGIRINGRDYPVTIATVFLGNDSIGNDYLRNNYASLDMNGDPIHAAASDASRLEKILASMTSTNILAGSILKHGAKGSPIQQTLNVMPYISNYMFELPAFFLDPSQISDNYELTFEYWDSHMNKFSVTGTLNLKK